LQEAAAILGVSLNTLRRRIDAGQVRADKVQRPQGHVWRVYLDSVQQPPAPAQQRSEQDAGSTLHQDADSTLQQPATSLMQAEAMAAYTRSVLEPLVTALERSEDHARELEHENGRLGAELERATTAVATLSSELEAERSAKSALEARTALQTSDATQESALSHWRLWVPWLLAALAIVVVVGLLVR